ncbi:MAG TPA: ABC transporter permease [Thermoanaerobaculia bacterium]|nr:ABC transporter permease [Thermoanaerobaculia bacterium]
MIEFRDVARQMLRDVRGQKLRTFLTVFGIIWGTVAISLLLAFGTGLHKQMIKNTAGLGDRILIVWPGLTSVPFEGLGKGRRIRLTEEDVRHIREQTQGLKAVSGEYSRSMSAIYGARTLPVDVSGVDDEFGAMRNMIPQAGGRFLNPLDVRFQRRVVFVGDEIATNLFGTKDPVGETLRIHGSPFLVVGVLVPKIQDSSYSGRDKDKMIIPGTTFRALTGDDYVNNLIVQPADPAKSKELIESLRRTVGERARFDPTDKEALSVWDTTEQFRFFDLFMLAFNSFLGIVGSLTLIVGGIGVSSIMNVVVEERTREIGIKMALGAKQRSILTQFLLETMLITAIGGAIGFLISIGICSVFPKFGLTEYVGDPKVSPLVASLTAGALGIVGLLAGYFPAREASRLDPVVAMKL